MKRVLVFALTVVLALQFGAVVFASGQSEADMAEGELPQVEAQIAHSPNPGGTAGAQAFKEYVESATDGRFTINPISYDALGSVREVTDQVRLGEMEFHAPGTVGLVGVWPDLQMVNMPFLFTDRQAFWEVMQDDEYVGYIRDAVDDASNGTIRYLGAAENSVRNLYTNTQVRVPDDMSGLMIRVQEAPIMQAVWSGLGAGEVVAMSGSERNAAVQAGTLDAIEGSFGGAWGGGNLAVLGNATLTGHVYDYMHYMVNSDFYDSLPAEYQQAVDEGIAAAVDAHNQAAFEDEAASIEEAEDAGVWVYQPTADELAIWQAQAVATGEEFLQEVVSDEFYALTFEVVERVHAAQ
ncbi:MAG TPA: TRAP transporter substrate-binding protein [Alkalispirochaeta sp.]|nr:TRAP transporter substrate-binding protein [Alkalispirochaeta sp.]